MKLMAYLIALASLAIGAGSEAPLGDATVQSGLPTNNFGSLPQLQVSPTATTYLRFRLLEGIPAGTTPAMVGRAVVTLHVNRVAAAGNVEFRYVVGTFDERTMTYSNAPPAEPPTGSFAVAAANTFVTFDVTALVRAALTSGAGTLSLALTAVGGTDAYFDSKENTATSHAPELTIRLTGPAGPRGETGPQGPQGLTGPAGSSSVLANLSTWQVRDYTINGGTRVSRTLSCPTGYSQLIAGGCGYPFLSSFSALSEFKIFYSGPDPDASNTRWQCDATNGSFSDQTLRIYVQCAK